MRGNHRCNRGPLDAILGCLQPRPPVHCFHLAQMLFLQSIMVAARSFGLDTCPQAALCSRHEILQKRLGIPLEQMVVCGMALGYADPNAIVNTFITERMALEGTRHSRPPAGVISKRRASPYLSGTRCGWIKVKTATWREANKDRGELFHPNKQTADT